MSPLVVAVLALVGFASGFVDAIAGGGLLMAPALALSSVCGIRLQDAMLDPC